MISNFLANINRCHVTLTQLFHYSFVLPIAILLMALIFGRETQAAGERTFYLLRIHCWKIWHTKGALML
jgi:hypothetical protein